MEVEQPDPPTSLPRTHFCDFGVVRAIARTLYTEHRTGWFAPQHLHFHTCTHSTCFVCHHAHVRVRLSRGSPWHVRPVGSLFHRDLPVYGGGASPEPLYRLCACGRCGVRVRSVRAYACDRSLRAAVLSRARTAPSCRGAARCSSCRRRAVIDCAVIDRAVIDCAVIDHGAGAP